MLRAFEDEKFDKFIFTYAVLLMFTTFGVRAEIKIPTGMNAVSIWSTRFQGETLEKNSPKLVKQYQSKYELNA